MKSIGSSRPLVQNRGSDWASLWSASQPFFLVAAILCSRMQAFILKKNCLMVAKITFRSRTRSNPFNDVCLSLQTALNSSSERSMNRPSNLNGMLTLKPDDNLSVKTAEYFTTDHTREKRKDHFMEICTILLWVGLILVYRLGGDWVVG